MPPRGSSRPIASTVAPDRLDRFDSHAGDFEFTRHVRVEGIEERVLADD